MSLRHLCKFGIFRPRLKMEKDAEFANDLILIASIKKFTGINSAKFCYQLAQPLQFDGYWQVILASMSFPSNINNMNSIELNAYFLRYTVLDATHDRTGYLRLSCCT